MRATLKEVSLPSIPGQMPALQELSENGSLSTYDFDKLEI